MGKNLKSSINRSGGKKIDNTVVDKYKNMNENQLMGEMMKAASESRAKGTLNNEDLDKFYREMSPMLTNEQRNRLKSLIDGLKN